MSHDAPDSRLSSIGSQVFLSSSDALLVLDRESLEILLANPKACEIYGYSEANLTGRSMPGLAEDPGSEEAELRGRDRDLGWDSVHHDQRGQPLQVEVRADEIEVPQTGGGEDRLLLVAVRDVTDRRRMDEQVLKAQKIELVGQLAGGIAHDFRNVLTAIIGYAQLAEASLPDLDRARTNLQGVQLASVRGTALANRLLVFARHDTVQLMDMEPGLVVEGLAPMLRRLLPGGVEMEVKVVRPLPTVRADQAYLEQIVMNLVVNACDACGTSGTVRVRLQAIVVPEGGLPSLSGAPPGEWVSLAVEDDGEGIPEEVLPRLFEPFFTTKSGTRGTGLGLSTVYTIVKRLHGHILVKSRPGEGARFVILLPVSGGMPARMPPVPAGGSAASAATSSLGTVLVMEDQDVVRRLVVRVLENQGYRVIACKDGDAGLSVNLSDVDYVVSDVLMPGTNGPEAVAAMRQQRPDLKVLFITAYADSELEIRALNRERILAKPFSPKALLAELAALDG